MAEWKKQAHFTVEASYERLSRVSCGDCNKAVPRMREPAKGETKALSEAAKFRLKLFDWYRNTPPRFSLAGQPDAKLACRHFGIRRSCFYRWKGRYDPKRLSAPENKPAVPKRKREPGSARELVRTVRAVREAYPGCSAKNTAYPPAGTRGSLRTLRVRAGKAHKPGKPVFPPRRQTA